MFSSFLLRIFSVQEHRLRDVASTWAGGCFFFNSWKLVSHRKKPRVLWGFDTFSEWLCKAIRQKEKCNKDCGGFWFARLFLCERRGELIDLIADVWNLRGSGLGMGMSAEMVKSFRCFQGHSASAAVFFIWEHSLLKSLSRSQKTSVLGLEVC